MENTAELARLEEFVNKLLDQYNRLKSEFHALEETLRARDAECTELKRSVTVLNSERSEVGSRVAGLLDRIEQWEVEQGSLGGNPQGALFGNDLEGRNE